MAFFGPRQKSWGLGWESRSSLYNICSEGALQPSITVIASVSCRCKYFLYVTTNVYIDCGGVGKLTIIRGPKAMRMKVIDLCPPPACRERYCTKKALNDHHTNSNSKS